MNVTTLTAIATGMQTPYKNDYMVLLAPVCVLSLATTLYWQISVIVRWHKNRRRQKQITFGILAILFIASLIIAPTYGELDTDAIEYHYNIQILLLNDDNYHGKNPYSKYRIKVLNKSIHATYDVTFYDGGAESTNNQHPGKLVVDGDRTTLLIKYNSNGPYQEYQPAPRPKAKTTY